MGSMWRRWAWRATALPAVVAVHSGLVGVEVLTVCDAGGTPRRTVALCLRPWLVRASLTHGDRVAFLHTAIDADTTPAAMLLQPHVTSGRVVGHPGKWYPVTQLLGGDLAIEYARPLHRGQVAVMTDHVVPPGGDDCDLASVHTGIPPSPTAHDAATSPPPSPMPVVVQIPYRALVGKIVAGGWRAPE